MIESGSVLTVLGIVLMVGPMPQLAILGAAGTVQLPLAQPHGKLRSTRNARALRDQRLDRGLEQLCTHMHTNSQAIPDLVESMKKSIGAQ